MSQMSYLIHLLLRSVRTWSGYRERLLLGEVWEDASNKVAYSQRRHYVKGRRVRRCHELSFA